MKTQIRFLAVIIFVLCLSLSVCVSANTADSTFSDVFRDTLKDVKAYSESNPKSQYPRLLKNKHTREIDPSKPMVALTFDDGPGQYTAQLLDCLKRNNAKATFFIVGNRIDWNKAALLRMRDEGHEIGSHTYNHPNLSSLDKNSIRQELSSTKSKIFNITGVNCTIVRPPYGACSGVVRNVGKELGISFYNWSFDTLDWKHRDPMTVHMSLINGAFDGAIVLCHDIHKSTVDAMETAVPALIKNGYQLVTVSELMAHSKYTVVPGGLYFRK